jgi:hypothetical protein
MRRGSHRCLQIVRFDLPLSGLIRFGIGDFRCG